MTYSLRSILGNQDKNPKNAEEAKNQFIKIGQAYDVLSDPNSRRRYDSELARGNVFSSFRFGGGRGDSYSGATHGGDNTETYESYRQAFDERMSNLSPEELNIMKNVDVHNSETLSLPIMDAP